MLLSLTGLAVSLVSGSAGWLARGMGDGALQPGNPPVTPRDPPTLTLALIGAGTMAVYILAKRRPSRTEGRHGASRLRDSSEQRAVASEEQRESRGAA